MFDENQLEVYDRIILPKSFKTPKRSRLYSLKPIGIRTPFAESLSS